MKTELNENRLKHHHGNEESCCCTHEPHSDHGEHHGHSHEHHNCCGEQDHAEHHKEGCCTHDHHSSDGEHHRHSHGKHNCHEEHCHTEHHQECCCGHDHSSHSHSEHDHCGHGHDCGCGHTHVSSKQMIFQFGFSAVFFAVGILSMIFFNTAYIFGLKAAPIFFVISWAAAGYQVVFASVKNILHGKIFDENFLMTIATTGAFILGEWAEGAAVMLFYNLGELVQHSAVDKSRKSIVDLMDLRPDFARLYKPGSDMQEEDNCVNPADVKVGSLILVKPGEKIPLDGIIMEGTGDFDTSSMTGESVPRSASAGEKVLGGFVNLTSVVIIKTTAGLENTAASKMLTLIETAQSRKAKVERFITSFAKVYTPIVTIGAVLISVLPPLLNYFIFSAPINGWQSFAPWFSRGLVFLVISCPCALVISVPLGYFGGIGGAAKRGILVKGADYIDALSKTKAVVFDKTGTLTKGILKVMTLMPSKNSDKDQLLKLAAIAESNSHHPIANAVKECAALTFSKEDYKNLSKMNLDNYTEIAGMGLSMDYDGQNLLAGKNSFITEKLKTEIPAEGNEIGGTQVYIAYGGKYIGCIILTDTLKPDSKEAISTLEKSGINRVEMLTGDNKKSAENIAAELGIKYFTPMLLPHEKVSRFEKISEEIKSKNKNACVIFVGDGINDAPVLARADAGIAMGAIGSDAAIEAADVVLMNDNPKLIPEAIRIARFTRKIVWENIALAFIIKIGFLTLGAFGLANLWAAVFADVGVALLAVFNSLRAKR